MDNRTQASSAALRATLEALRQMPVYGIVSAHVSVTDGPGEGDALQCVVRIV